MLHRSLLVILVLLCLTAPLSAQESALTLTAVGTYATPDVGDGGASEIVAYDPATKTLFSINGTDNTLDRVDATDPAAMTLIDKIDLSAYGVSPTSVAVKDGTVAVAVLPEDAAEMGKVAFFDTTGVPLSAVTVGSHPDMVTFTHDFQRVLVANEGEPTTDYAVDGEGSVSVIDLSGGAASLTDANVTTIGFTDFNEGGSRHAEIDASIRIYSPNATVAQDLEPEYIAVSPDDQTAYVTLQENEAIGVIDLTNNSVVALKPLGFKDFNAPGNSIDASDKDDKINIANWPVWGMYEPDGIAAYAVGDAIYLVTANEGDTRGWDAYNEESRVADLTLDPTAFPNAADLQKDENLGRLTVTTANGDTDGDGDFDALYVPGGRSFSIWSADGELVFDSGDQFEQITARLYPDNFNDSGTNGEVDSRSDNKSVEPEGVALGVIGDKTYAFIAFERIGGVMVFDVTDPQAPAFVTYANNRDFGGTGASSDVGPEGIVFLPADASPSGKPMVLVGNEVSGTATFFEIEANEA